ncbi:MAG TPA: class I SAM-dependent methyltransferase [Phycisphaerae bacterium]|nr:class I SAM-dependent methyltransferase [Phycisphaerae bacterium]
MNLMDIVRRQVPPTPWAEGEKIPWNDPAFSERMLAEHLSQAHDAASRRLEKIDRHVRWVHHELLERRPTRILELGCGPGLYTSRFAKRGHECVGIDFGPASIRHATETAEREKLACTYRLADVREAEFGEGFGLVMMIYGEFCVFRQGEAERLLARSFDALAPGGLLLLEPYTCSGVRELAARPPSWQAKLRGLFTDRPHLFLIESFWDESAQAATSRYYVVDAETGEVERSALTTQAYREDQFAAMLARCGFSAVRFVPSLTGEPDEAQPDLFALVARKP